METTTNYDKVIEEWRLRFLKMNQEDLIRRFHLNANDTVLYLTYFSHEMCIHRSTGVISYTNEPERRPNFHTAMTIYNMFHYATEYPQASNQLVPFRDVKRVYPYEAAYRKTILNTLEETFAGQAERLRQACICLHGIDMGKGDVGYMLPVFPFLNIAVFFWDGDEEFPAQANMLFDSNITDFVHEENVVSIAADAVYYLTEAAKLPPVNI